MLEKIKEFFRSKCPVCNDITYNVWGHYRDKMVEEYEGANHKTYLEKLAEDQNDVQDVLQGIHVERLFQKRSKLELVELYKETKIDRWKPEGGLIIAIGFITMIMIFIIIDMIALTIIRINPIGMIIYLVIISILGFITYLLAEKLVHMHAKHLGWLRVLENLANKKQPTLDEMAILRGEKDVLDMLDHIDDDDDLSLTP